VLLALVGVLDADDSIAVLNEFGDMGLLENLDALGQCDGEVLYALELGVGDDHTRELSTTAVCALLRVTAEAGDEGEVEIELVLEPVDGVCGATSKDLDEVVACEVFCRFLRVVEEDLGVVLDALCELGTGSGAVDTTSIKGSAIYFEWK
jgi:hypothetical protein